MTNTLNQQPLYASLQLTDLLFTWQAGQSPSTRKMPVSGLSQYYALLTGATFSGGVTISSGGLAISSGGANITGSSAITGPLTVTSGVTASGNSIFNVVQLGSTTIVAPLTVDGVSLLNNSTYAGIQGYLAGLTLSNDVSTPNSVLDITAGWCTDSTNEVPIIIASAFTKSTAGTWVAGSGANGMGTGLVVAASTWYHVFAFIGSAGADIYFDTSLTAANAPAGMSFFRRIGSFLTDGSAHIVAFSQFGDEFIYTAAIEDVTADTALSNTRVLYTLPSVPLGLTVTARVRVSAVNSGVVAGYVFASPSEATLNGFNVTSPTVSNAGTAELLIRTDSSQRIAALSTAAANNTLSIWTVGWTDTRGRFT